jgi:hypothetical protein
MFHFKSFFLIYICKNSSSSCYLTFCTIILTSLTLFLPVHFGVFKDIMTVFLNQSETICFFIYGTHAIEFHNEQFSNNLITVGHDLKRQNGVKCHLSAHFKRLVFLYLCFTAHLNTIESNTEHLNASALQLKDYIWYACL